MTHLSHEAYLIFRGHVDQMLDNAAAIQDGGDPTGAGLMVQLAAKVGGIVEALAANPTETNIDRLCQRTVLAANIAVLDACEGALDNPEYIAELKKAVRDAERALRRMR